MEIKKILTELMTEKQVSQSQLARDIGLDQTTISKTLLGKNTPSIETAIKLAKYFDITVGQLVGTEEL